MIDNELIEKLRLLKDRNEYALDELSKRLDMQISTVGRWFKTGRTNKIYAKIVKERLGIK